MSTGQIQFNSGDCITGTKLAHDAIFGHRAAQKPAELATFIDFLIGRPIHHVLEIGGFYGGTLWAWAHLATGKLVCVDNFRLGPEMEDMDLPYTLVNADSHLESTRDKIIQEFNEEPVDLLFIDGDHTLEGVRSDLELYVPLVRKGGVIGMHDTAKPHQFPDLHNVIPAWEEIRERYVHFQIFDPVDEGHWGGIGVLLP